jgi:sialic acid synthase SpsE
MSVFLVGEIAAAHDNDWRQVERLVALCAEAGFSACKLQYWSDPDALADRRHATPEYRAIYRRYAIPVGWLPLFASLCHAHGLEAVCSVFLPSDVEAVAAWMDRAKVASFECEDESLLSAVRATGKPWIVSCGMGGRIPNGDERMLAMGCVSQYPAALDGALATVCFYDGYSDHTANMWTGAVAVGAGASVIEVHVRLDDTDPENPDYATALDPARFRLYAEGVRTAERLLADVVPDESAMRRFKVKADGKP